MKGDELTFLLLTPLALTGKEDGRKLLQLWAHYLPTHFPEKCGNWEPPRHPCDRTDIDAALELWRWPFLAVRRRPKMESSVFMHQPLSRTHADWKIDMRLSESNPQGLVEFVKRAARELHADLACLTLLTAEELEIGRRNGTVTALNKAATRFSFYITTHKLRRSLPEVYWLTVLGPPYVELFGKGHLLSVPAYRVEENGEEMVVLQLSERISDVRDEPVKLQKARAQIKSFLGPDAFFQPGKEDGYRVPLFSLSKGVTHYAQV